MDQQGFAAYPDQGFVNLSVYIEKWNSLDSIDQFVKDTETTKYLKSLSLNGTMVYISRTKEVVAENNSGRPLLTQLYADFLSQDSSQHYLLILSYDKTLPTERDINQYLSDFDQILQTFQFTDQDKQAYVCPKTQSIDCMPIVDESRKDQCDPAYLRWIQTYCPGVTITQ